MRRYATVASISHRPQAGCDSAEGRRRLLADAEQLLRRAQRMGADIVAFPEVYPHLTLSNPYQHIEPADGGTLDRVCELARETGMYIIWPRYESSAAGPRNSAILVDRRGTIVGRYYKMFPTIGEMDNGIVPGTECSIFQTDFGRVAVTICFDLNFMDIRDQLRPKQPDLVFFCSMYRGGLQLQEWALDLGCYVVSAIAAELGRIVDPGGQVLKVATYEALITQRVNLNKRQLHMDNNWDKMDAILQKYGRDVTFDFYTQEARFVIGCERENVDVDEIINEFGLEQREDYFARARRLRREKLVPHLLTFYNFPTKACGTSTACLNLII